MLSIYQYIQPYNTYGIFYCRDKEILQRCGPDASLYLSLERYLIALLCVLSLLSLAVILPINYFAGSLGVCVCVGV